MIVSNPEKNDDELYIGRMGAGCECNYFQGLLDDVRIGSHEEYTLWEFTEGEGSSTEDSQGLIGEIHGANFGLCPMEQSLHKQSN